MSRTFLEPGKSFLPAGALIALLAGACASSHEGSTTAGGSSGRTVVSGTGTSGAAGGGSGSTSGAGSSTGAAPGTACSGDGECASGLCGVAGEGNCCAQACAGDAGACDAEGCDDGGACLYPGTNVPCGPSFTSCSGTSQLQPAACDGKGGCPGTSTDCAPYACGAAACLSICSTSADCAPGNACDLSLGSCCDGPSIGGRIAVDAASGDDALACCGLGGNGPCRTIARAMSLIDSAQTPGVTLQATVGDGGGDWTAPDEPYPIVLGWGAELNAPGVYFTDPVGQDEIIDIVAYSANDHTGYASITGVPGRPIAIGMNRDGGQSADGSSIQVETRNTLYLANADVNGSATFTTTAITVLPDGGLVLGRDYSGAILGTVQIGPAFPSPATDGFIGISCLGGQRFGCTVSDALLPSGSSVVIQGQEGADIVASDFASISLTSAPVIGFPPKAVGFQTCLAKSDATSAYAVAVTLYGQVTMTFAGGTVQCVAGDGFLLEDSPIGYPTLTLQGSTIQNCGGAAVHAFAGAATVSGSTLRFNHFGAWQDYGGAIDLDGERDGGVAGGRNTVICSSRVESLEGSSASVGVSVLNQTYNVVLDADNVDWDTSGPDVFSCAGEDGFCSSPVCVNPHCDTEPGADGMDALYIDAAATISTSGNQLSPVSCVP